MYIRGFSRGSAGISATCRGMRRHSRIPFAVVLLAPLLGEAIGRITVWRSDDWPVFTIAVVCAMRLSKIMAGQPVPPTPSRYTLTRSMPWLEPGCVLTSGFAALRSRDGGKRAVLVAYDMLRLGGEDLRSRNGGRGSPRRSTRATLESSSAIQTKARGDDLLSRLRPRNPGFLIFSQSDDRPER